MVVSKGFFTNQGVIKVHLSDIAIMQLLDVPNPLCIDANICGSNRIYLAPEIISSRNSNDKITGKVDVYSVGAIMYLLITKGHRDGA